MIADKKKKKCAFSENTQLPISGVFFCSYKTLCMLTASMCTLCSLFHTKNLVAFVCVEVLRPSQPNRVMSSTFTGQA